MTGLEITKGNRPLSFYVVKNCFAYTLCDE
jgi:hypothetical protein